MAHIISKYPVHPIRNARGRVSPDVLTELAYTGCVSGHVYDVTIGLIATVIPPGTVHASAPTASVATGDR